jgi:ketosteroid isomerase-like protein
MEAQDFARKWKEACNSHDLERILAIYSETVVFKSPRVRTLSGEQSGTLHGKEAIRGYWQSLLAKRPHLTFEVGRVFAGVDSIALEYRVGDVQGIEFMLLDKDGLISLAAGNDQL